MTVYQGVGSVQENQQKKGNTQWQVGVRSHYYPKPAVGVDQGRKALTGTGKGCGMEKVLEESHGLL